MQWEKMVHLGQSQHPTVTIWSIWSILYTFNSNKAFSASLLPLFCLSLPIFVPLPCLSTRPFTTFRVFLTVRRLFKIPGVFENTSVIPTTEISEASTRMSTPVSDFRQTGLDGPAPMPYLNKQQPVMRQIQTQQGRERWSGSADTASSRA